MSHYLNELSFLSGGNRFQPTEADGGLFQMGYSSAAITVVQ
jgi:hypothetical protein